jgi:hypothetical protein
MCFPPFGPFDELLPLAGLIAAIVALILLSRSMERLSAFSGVPAEVPARRTKSLVLWFSTVPVALVVVILALFLMTRFILAALSLQAGMWTLGM